MDVPRLDKEGMLSIPACRLDAQQVDELLRHLAIVRSKMTPRVPAHIDITTAVVVDQPNPTLAVGKHASGGITLGLRHDGYGWLVYELPAMDAAALAAFITKRTAGVDVRFVDDQIADTDGTKH